MYRNSLQNQQGFTLIEILSVMLIFGILISTTIHRFGHLSDTAGKKSLAVGIRELNVRESLIWFQLKISTADWPGDDDVFNAVETDLGAGYFWEPAPAPEGGSLHFKSHSAGLARIPSTIRSPAVWQ